MKTIESFFTNDEVLEFIRKNKFYQKEAEIKFYSKDYRSKLDEMIESFDLLISLNAGFISQACKKYLKSRGILIVNDEHYDARRVFVDNEFRLLAVFDKVKKEFNYSNNILHKYFRRKEDPITLEMVEISATKSPSKDPYKPKLHSPFNLFQKK